MKANNEFTHMKLFMSKSDLKPKNKKLSSESQGLRATGSVSYEGKVDGEGSVYH